MSERARLRRTNLSLEMAIFIIVIIGIIFLNSTDDRSRLCSDRANIKHVFEIIIKPSWCRQTIILNTEHSEEN